MIHSENRFPLFRIMLEKKNRALTGPVQFADVGASARFTFQRGTATRISIADLGGRSNRRLAA